MPDSTVSYAGTTSLAAQTPVRSQDTALRCDVVPDFHSIETLREAWDATALQLDAPVCMTFDWVKTWWEHYGEGRQLRVFLFWRNHTLVSVLPLYLESFGIGPWKTVVARIVGANLPPRCVNPPVSATYAQAVLDTVQCHLFKRDRCDLLAFGPVSRLWPAFRAVETALGPSRKPLGAASYDERDVQTLFALTAEFIEALRSRKSVRRYLGHLARRGGVTTDFVDDQAELLNCFEAFARQHAEQWRKMGKGGHFKAWPNGHEFHRALIRRQGQLGRVRFYRILADGEMIAACYTFIFGTRVFAELSSRALEPEWERLGLGKAVVIAMCQSAAAIGALSVDGGLGHYTYKSLLGGEVVPVGMWRIVRMHWNSRIRSFVLLKTGKLIRIMCDKIWYRRILPHLPDCIARSQSRWWLRFDA